MSDYPSPPDHGDRASIRIFRRIDWIDTDAGGIYHWTTVFRLAEQAEAALFTVLGHADALFGVTPRVAVEMQFVSSLVFNDRVAIDLAVAKVGRSSIVFSIQVSSREGVAASGQLTICVVDPATRKSTELPPDLRAALLGAGPQEPLD